MINQGFIAEQIFIVECLKRDIFVSVPILKEIPYDFIIDKNKLLKIQVKSCANYKLHGKQFRYRIDVTKGTYINKKSYQLTDFDFAAIFLIKHCIWYLIPIANVQTNRWISINPENNKDKFINFKENWNFL